MKPWSPLLPLERDRYVENAQKNRLGITLHILFVVWLATINVLYYMQYSDLLFSRFGAWFHRWR